MQGWALAELGQKAEGLQQIRQGEDTLTSIGVELWKPYVLALLGEAYGHLGRIEEDHVHAR